MFIYSFIPVYITTTINSKFFIFKIQLDVNIKLCNLTIKEYNKCIRSEAGKPKPQTTSDYDLCDNLYVPYTSVTTFKNINTKSYIV